MQVEAFIHWNSEREISDIAFFLNLTPPLCAKGKLIDIFEEIENDDDKFVDLAFWFSLKNK